MDKQEDKGFQELFTKVKDYVDTNIELKKLSIIQQAVLTISGAIASALLAISVFMFWLFLNIALGFYLSYLLNDTYSGFFIVAGFYVVLSLIIYLVKDNYIKNPLINLFIKKIFKSNQK